MKQSKLNNALVLLVIACLALLVFKTVEKIDPLQAQTRGLITCENSIVINTSSAATTRIITNASTEQRIYVCNVDIMIAGGATPQNLKFQYSATANACASGVTDLTGVIVGVTSAAQPIYYAAGTSTGLAWKPIPVANDLCIITTQASVVGGVLTYTVM